MRIVFRVDASLQMGTGHVMRCLTLAEALRGQGGDCHFIMRLHAGNLVDMVRQRGFTVHVLPVGANVVAPPPSADRHQLFHVHWLGCDWSIDAEQTRDVLMGLRPHWLVVDHYSLDARWESELAPLCEKIMVIDDLADRRHQCDLLLDQTLGRTSRQYANLLPDSCKVLVGPQYALLRPEFAALRLASLRRRRNPVLRSILVTMGGVDQHNATGAVLQALGQCLLPKNCRIRVVMGPSAPWVQEVQALASAMPWPTEVLSNVGDMARCMAGSDLAIGAAGGTSWERCCLGLPTLMIVLAENQQLIADSLVQAGAVIGLNDMKSDAFEGELRAAISTLVADPTLLRKLSERAASITSGEGVHMVSEAVVSEKRR